MAVDYELIIDSSMTLAECVKLLTRELALEAWFGPGYEGGPSTMWLRNSGLRSMYVVNVEAPDSVRLWTEVMGFAPSVRVSMRPSPTTQNYERGMQTMMRTINLVLRSAPGDVGFAYECERVHILRRNGVLYVRVDFEKYLRAQDLALITLPVQRKALRP